jgi:purine-binding chemotaxis protein CheW
VKPLIHRPQPFEPTPPDVDDVLLRRADRMRRKRANVAEEQDTTAAGSFWVAQIRVAGDTYALPLGQVRAAMPLRMVSPVPLAPSFVLGILRFRGEAVVAMSLVSLLGVRGWRVDPAVLIIVETGRRRIALDCEEVPQAAPISRALVEEARAQAAGTVVTRVPGRDGKALLLIGDLELLIRSPSEVPGVR